jgi:hypothetical protein
MEAPLEPADRDRLRRLLLAKGAELNDQLTRLLDGKEVALETLVGGGDPGETPAERVRRFLDLIDARLGEIRAGTYGRCATCGERLGLARLEQMPWADRCAACAANPK